MNPNANLGVTLSAGTAYLGGEFDLALEVSNHGPSDIEPGDSLTLTHTWTGEASFVSAAGEGWSCSGSWAEQEVVCSRTAPLAAGEASTVSVRLLANGLEDSAQQAAVNSALADLIPANNTAAVVVSVQPAVNLYLDKTVEANGRSSCPKRFFDPCDPVLVEPGGVLTYTVWVENPGELLAPQVSLTDTLPAGVSFLAFVDQSAWDHCSVSEGVIACTLDGLEARESAALTFSARAPGETGPLVNHASASSGLHDPAPADNTASAGAEVTRLAALSLSPSSPAQEIYASQAFSFALQVSNAGPHSAALVLTDTLPLNAAYLGASGAGWACDPARGQELVCRRAALAPGETAALELSFQASENAGQVTNRAVVNSPDSADLFVEDNAGAQRVMVRPAAALSLQKTVSAPVVNSGAVLTYTLTIANGGPSPASGIVLTDYLPQGAGFLSARSDFAGTTCQHREGVVTCAVNPALNVLLVDASGSDWEEASPAWNYAQALDELGVPYTRLDASVKQITPADLEPYALVFWVLSSRNAPSAADEAALAAFLDGGGRLWMAGSGYFSASGNQELTPFLERYLGVGSFVLDSAVRPDPIQGQNLFGGFGPYHLFQYFQVDQVNPNALAQTAFSGEHFASGEPVPVGLYTGRTVFFTFPWNEIYTQDPEGARGILQTVLAHLARPLNPGERVTVTLRAWAPTVPGDYSSRAELSAFTHDEDAQDNQASASLRTEGPPPVYYRTFNPMVLHNGAEVLKAPR